MKRCAHCQSELDRSEVLANQLLGRDEYSNHYCHDCELIEIEEARKNLKSDRELDEQMDEAMLNLVLEELDKDREEKMNE